jgi:hypothetical protein
MTDSHDLDGADYIRDSGVLIAGALTTAAGAALAIWGIANAKKNCTAQIALEANSNCQSQNGPQGGWLPVYSDQVGSDAEYYNPSQKIDNVGADLLGGLGVGAAVIGASFLVYGALNADGTSDEHVVTKFDAQLYAAKYNRELLRKTIQDTKERMKHLSGKNNAPSFTILPIASPGFTGIIGTF